MEEFLYALDGREEGCAGGDVDDLLLVDAGVGGGDGRVVEWAFGYFGIWRRY